MFSIPSTPHFSSNNENANGTVARKPGATSNISLRKALGDRGVNGPTFNTPREVKPECKPEAQPVEKSKDVTEDDLFNYDISSYKELEDDFIDICPKSQRLTRDNAINILQWYCRELPTPLPDFTLVTNFLEELPEESQDFNNSFLPEEVSIDDVSLPEIDFEDSESFLA